MTLRESRSILCELEPQIAALEKRRNHLVTWRAELIARLDATPVNSLKVYGLQLSLQRIDRGLDLVNECYPAHMPLDDLLHQAASRLSAASTA